MTPETGPGIKAFGPVFSSPANAYNLVPGQRYKVRSDVAAGSGEATTNRGLESAARFLNMHAQLGIQPEILNFALVVHGSATQDLLHDEAYRLRFGQENPNTALLVALTEADVDIYLCAQSASYKGFDWKEFHPAVTVAVSAMTAHVRLESEGYTVIPF